MELFGQLLCDSAAVPVTAPTPRSQRSRSPHRWRPGRLARGLMRRLRHQDQELNEQVLDRINARIESFAAQLDGLVQARPANPGLLVGLRTVDKDAVGVAGNECNICMSPLDEDGNVLKQMPGCGHLFHETCISLWLKRACCCPNCRRGIIKPGTVVRIVGSADVLEGSRGVCIEERTNSQWVVELVKGGRADVSPQHIEILQPEDWSSHAVFNQTPNLQQIMENFGALSPDLFARMQQVFEDKTAWQRVVDVGMELVTNPAAMQRWVDVLSSDMSGDEDPAMRAVKGMTAEILSEVKTLSSNPRMAAIIQRDLRQTAEFVAASGSS